MNNMEKNIEEIIKSLFDGAGGLFNTGIKIENKDEININDFNNIKDYIILLKKSNIDFKENEDFMDLLDFFKIDYNNFENNQSTFVFPKKIKNNKTTEEQKENIFKELNKKLNLTNELKRIIFKIGQPNTGKSFGFEENNLFNFEDLKNGTDYVYEKIMIPNDISFTNNDLSVSYNSRKQEFYFTRFLITLMSAIFNPKIPHIVFLDDFHNKDISSLLSNYTGMLKQSFEINNDITDTEKTDIKTVENWNSYINSLLEENNNITDKSSRIEIGNGESLNLFFPNNFYILGASNFNKNSLNIFADIRERAIIEEVELKTEITKETENEYEKIVITLNKAYSEVLEEIEIYDFHKYGVGTHRYSKVYIENEESKKSDIKQIFGLYKSSLIENGKKSEVEEIMFKLFKKISVSNGDLKNLIFGNELNFFTDKENIDENIKKFFNKFKI